MSDSTIAARMRAIESEFNEPLHDTIIGLRETLTWKNVAGALEINEKTLRSYRRRLGLPVNVHARNLDETSLPALDKTEQRARALGYENALDAITTLRLVEKKTQIETARTLGIGRSSVEKHTPRELFGLRCYSARGLANLRARARELNASRSNSNHPWRQDEHARVRR